MEPKGSNESAEPVEAIRPMGIDQMGGPTAAIDSTEGRAVSADGASAQRRCEMVEVVDEVDGTASMKEVCVWAPNTEGFASRLGIQFVSASPTCAEARMPITDGILQPFGFVHGGATLALLETVGSEAAAWNLDLQKERVFGIRMDVRHKKSGKQGWVRGVAELEHEERGHAWWHVTAYDDSGDVMSEGTFETKRVTLAYLAEKEAKRRAQRNAQ